MNSGAEKSTLSLILINICSTQKKTNVQGIKWKQNINVKSFLGQQLYWKKQLDKMSHLQ